MCYSVENFRIIILGEMLANRIKINEMHISVTKPIVELETLETPSKQNAPNLNLALLDVVAFVIVSTFYMRHICNMYRFRLFFSLYLEFKKIIINRIHNKCKTRTLHL